MNDISFTPFAASQMEKIEPNLSKKFEDVGFKFNAGIQLYYPNILAKGTVTIENKVVIINALVIALGFTPYWVEKINAINPTGADATMMVVSANEKSILSKFHIIKINKTG